MNKLNLILLAFTVLTLPTLSYRIFSRGLTSTTCCSACPEYSVVPSTVLLTKYQMGLVSLLSCNCTVSNVLSLMRKLPLTWTPNLYNKIDQLSFRNSSNLTSKGEVDTKSYASVSQGTINFLLNATKRVIEADLENNSFNYRNTEANFVQTIRTNYNSMFQSVQQTGTLIDGTQTSTENLNYFTMFLTMNLISSLTNQGQQAIKNCVDYDKIAASFVPNFNQKFNVSWQMPIQDEYFESTLQTFDSSYISNSNNSFFFNKTTLPNLNCTFESEIDGNLSNPAQRLTETSSTGAIWLTTYHLWFERRNQDQTSIYNPIFIDFFNALTFDGTVYNPSNNDLSVLPNGGFAANQTSFDIWNKIENNVFGSLLFYKFPGVRDALQQTCPMTCNHSC